MQCFRCLQKGHTASRCINKITNTNIGKQSDDGKSKSIKSRYSTKTNKAASITKLHNSRIKMKEVLSTLNTRIEAMYNEYSDLTNSDDNCK